MKKLAVAILLVVFLMPGCVGKEAKIYNNDEWAPRSVYKEGNKVLFSFVRSDPYKPVTVTTGVKRKALWIFYDHMDKFKGKTMTVKVFGSRVIKEVNK